MNLVRIAYSIIAALSEKDALVKYPQYQKDIEYFSSKDPTKGKNKYLEWELKILESGQALSAEIADVVELFEKFGKNLEKRDIYQYKFNEFTELRDQLFELKDNQSGRKDKVQKRYKLEEVPDSEKIFENDDFEVLWIKNKAASIFHGQGSKWCITMKGASYYEEYQLSNCVFFFVLNKKSDISDPLYKIAISYQRDVDNNTEEKIFWNSYDKQLSDYKVSKYLGDSFNSIMNVCDQKAKDAPKSALAKFGSGEELSKKEQEDLVKSDNKEIKKAISSNENLTPYMIELLFDENDVNTNIGIAYNHSTPPYILEKLSNSEDYDVLSGVVRNPNTDANTLEKFSNHESAEIRAFLGTNTNLPRSIIEKLSTDKDLEVRSVIASNPLTPVEILENLLDDDHEVLASLASNKNITPGIIEALSESHNKEVLNALGANKKVSSEILILLARKKDPHIQRGIARNSNINNEIANEIIEYGDHHSITSLLNNPKIPVEIIESFSDTEDPEFIKSISSNPKSPPEVLHKFSKTGDFITLVWLCGNPNTPLKTLEEISENENEELRGYADKALKRRKSSSVASISLNMNFSDKIYIWDKYLDSMSF